MQFPFFRPDMSAFFTPLSAVHEGMQKIQHMLTAIFGRAAMGCSGSSYGVLHGSS
jgi:hypothetical protein